VSQRSKVEHYKHRASRNQDRSKRFRPLGSLPQLLKLAERNAELPQNLEKQRRTDLTAAVKRNSHGPTIRMIPTLMTSRLPRLRKAQPPSRTLQLAGRRARHERFL
jgi:hypothetical protein